MRYFKSMELFNLKAVLKLTGLNPDTVRAWEKRYQAVKPIRAENGRRMYSETEVQRLKSLAELSYLGHTIGTIANLPDQQLHELLEKAKTNRPVSKSGLQNSNYKKLIESLIEAVNRYDLPRLEYLLSRSHYLLGIREIVLQLIPELMREVGAQVENQELNFAQEHALSEMVKKMIRQFLDQMEPLESGAARKGLILLTTPENHLHEFGVLISAILTRAHGFQTHYLGPNLPAQALISACKEMNPTAVIIGFSPVTGDQQKSEPMKYLKELDQELGPKVDLWLGGFVPKFKRSEFKHKLWNFESLEDLEKMVKDQESLAGRSS